MKKTKLLVILGALALSGCGVARTAGDVAVTGGQVVLGAADLIL